MAAEHPAACDCPTCTEAAARPGMAQVTHVESAAKGWICPVDGTTAPHLGDDHAVACPKCGRKMVPRV